MSDRMRNVRHIALGREAVGDTVEHLRACGRRGVEGLVLWAGPIAGSYAEVSEVLVPRQDGRRTAHGLLVTIDGDELHRINVHLRVTGQRLIGQVHSHPTHAYHSAVDDEHAIATEIGCVSLVVPDFAAAPFAIEDCAVYRLTESWWPFALRARWSRLGPSGAASLFVGEEHHGAR